MPTAYEPYAAPPPRCRKCLNLATRYIPGAKRTFYCNEHGPTKAQDWQRLVTLPGAAGTVGFAVERGIGATPPFPQQFATLLETFVEGARSLFQQSLTQAASGEALVALEREVEGLRAQLAQAQGEESKLRTELDRAEERAKKANEIADEAIALWESSATSAEPEITAADTTAEQPTPTPEPPAPPVSPAGVSVLDEARLAKPKPEPTRAPPVGVRTKKRVEAEAPKRPSKGYVIEPPAQPHHAPEPAPRQPTERPAQMPGSNAITVHNVDFYSFDAHLLNLPRGPEAPGLSTTRRAIRAFAGLPNTDKVAVLDKFTMFADKPLSVRLSRLGLSGSGLYTMFIRRHLRVILGRNQETMGSVWVVLDIVDRNDSTIFTKER